jgi:hypothetical protein
MALWLTPLLLSVSGSFYRLSWTYMNVDIIGAAFILATVVYLVQARVRDAASGRTSHGLRRAVIAGILAGLAVGSKYNLFPILVPCVLWFFLYERSRFISRTLVVGAVSVGTFFVTTPYALFDFRTFFHDVAKEARHYATGHVGATVDAGWPMVVTYWDLFVDSYGWVPLVLSITGLAILFRRDYKLALVTFSHPLVFTAYMCAQRVFFARNVVVVHVFIAIALTIALVELPGIVVARLARRWPTLGARRGTRLASMGLMALIAVVGLPWGRIGLLYASGVEPRNDAARWIEKNLNPRSTIVVEEDVQMDVRRLSKQRFKIVELDLPKDKERFEQLRSGRRRVFVVIRARPSYTGVLRGSRVVGAFMRPPDTPGGAGTRAVEILRK